MQAGKDSPAADGENEGLDSGFGGRGEEPVGRERVEDGGTGSSPFDGDAELRPWLYYIEGTCIPCTVLSVYLEVKGKKNTREQVRKRMEEDGRWGGVRGTECEQLRRARHGR